MSLATYDAPNGSYTSAIPSGTAAFRTVLADIFGFTRTEVIRDQSRCAHQRSEHCECGAVDAFVTDPIKGRKVFEACVKAADVLGIQSVIFRDREIGFGNPNERNRTKADHYDHVHIGLNRWARQHLTQSIVREAFRTQEDDMTPEQVKDLFARLAKIEKALYLGDEEEVHVVATKLDALTAKLDAYMAAHP